MGAWLASRRRAHPQPAEAQVDPGPGTGGVCAAQAIVTRQSDTATARAIFEAECERLTGVHWPHAMNDFEDMMHSVERHGDICKPYAI
jgi:hypothetical protein